MRKIVLFTYEFTYSPFSGNGILARSLVKSFLGLGCTVTVWCCRPSSVDVSNSSDNHLAPPEISQELKERLKVLSTVVPSHAWRRVDDQSCWRDFCVANLSDVDRLETAISEAGFVCVIDWSGAVACRSIRDHLQQQQTRQHAEIASKFHMYLNFRVFSSGVDDPKLRDWYNKMEYKAMEHANAIVSLSSLDSQQLSSILQSKDEKNCNPRIPIEIVVPPLRQDMESFAKTNDGFFLHLPKSIQSRITNSGSANDLFSKRPIVACVARQSPEKCIQRFVKFCEMAATVLKDLNLKVVLCGAISDVEYAKDVRERLLQAIPSAIVMDRFLSPKELGAVFAHTLLNFHPSFYDAYGMTIVEAAAFGAPSVVSGPSVGAYRLLGRDGCLPVAMEPNGGVFSESSLVTIVNFLQDSQTNQDSWKRLSSVARKKALAWDEKSYGERMLQIVDTHAESK